MKKLIICMVALTSVSAFAGSVCKKELRDCKLYVRDGYNHYGCFPQENDSYSDLDSFCNGKRKEFKATGMENCMKTFNGCKEDHEFTPIQQQERPSQS